MRTLLLCFGVAVASIVGTVALFVLYATISDARTTGKDRVSFSELLADVEAGHVEEISVHGQIYTFKRRPGDGPKGTREALGPVADGAELLTLRPSDPSLPAPRVVTP